MVDNVWQALKVANFYSNKREPLARRALPSGKRRALAIARLAILRLLPCLEHVLTKPILFLFKNMLQLI